MSAAAFAAGEARAQVQRPFTVRAGTGVNIPGDIFIIGNSSLRCSTTRGTFESKRDCPAARNRAGADLDNNDYFTDNVDVDNDFSTFNSSSATFSTSALGAGALGPGASVVWAGLYWMADLHPGESAFGFPEGNWPPNVFRRNRVLLRTPTSGSYVEVRSTQEDQVSLSGNSLIYQEFAEVTDLVRAGATGTYTVANIQAGTGNNRSAGWALVILVEDPTLPMRNLTVFDGSAQVDGSHNVNIAVSGFTTPRVGSVSSRVGFVAIEGDIGRTGDRVRLNNVELGNATHPQNNFFNSAITRLGGAVERNPPDGNTFGFDIAYVATTGILPNGATSATITMTPSDDAYVPQVVAVATDIFSASLSNTVFKTVTDLNGGTVKPGDTLEYVISVHNASGDGVKHLTIVDTIAPHTIYAAGSLRILSGPGTGTLTDASDGDRAAFESAGNRVVFHLGAVTLGETGVLLPGEATSIRYRVVVASVTPANTTIRDQAVVSYEELTLGTPHADLTDGDPTTPGSQPTTIVTTQSGDVKVTKVGPANATTGSNFSYEILAENLGPGGATNVVVIDTVAAGLTIVSTEPAARVVGRIVTWDTLHLFPAGQRFIGRVTVQTTSAGTFTNVGAATNVGDPNPANNNGSAPESRVQTVVRVPETDIRVVVTGPDTALADRDITYTITVKNVSTVAAQNVQVIDTMDVTAPVRGASGGGTRSNLSTSNPRTTWPVIPSLAPGASESFTLTVHTPLTGGTIVTVGGATSTTGDLNPSNNDGSAEFSRVTTYVPPPADVTVTKSGPIVALPNATITYQIVVGNIGGGAGTNVVVTDTLSPRAAFVSADKGGTATGSVVSWPAIATLASGAADTFTVVVRAPANADTLVDNAAASLTNSDLNLANNNGSSVDARVTTIVVPPAALSVQKTGPATIGVGSIATWVITGRNGGPGVARNVRLTDTLPASVTFIGASNGGTLNGRVVSWPVIALVAAGQSSAVTVTVRAPLTTGPLVNVATVTAATTDPDLTDNRVQFQTDVVESADVVVASVTPPPVPAGSRVTLDVGVTNHGPSPSANVVLTDTLPLGATFVSASGGGTVSGQTVTWPVIPVLALNETRAFTLTIDVPAVTGATATVFAAVAQTLDPVASNNTVTQSIEIGPAPVPTPDVSVTKIAPTTVIAGARVIYLIAVANSGPGDAANVVVTDTLPAGVTVVSTTGGPTQSGNVLTWPNIPVLASGDKREFAVEVTAPAEAATITDIAAATTTSADPTLANNRATATTTVTASADVSVDKAGPATVVGGTSVTYTITVRNAGPSTAAGVVVNDTLPPGATVTSASGGGTAAGGVVTWPTIATLAAGATQVFTLVITAPAVGSFINAVAATATTADPNTANNRAALQTTSASPPPTTNADVSVGKSAPASVVAGATITYSISVANAGPLDAANVSVTDTLPAGTTFVSATGGGTVTGNVVHWPVIASLASGSTQPFSLLVTAPAEAATLTNIAAATSTTPDSVTANNRAPATTTVTASANVRIAKTGPSTATTSTAITYSLTVTNDGPSAAQTVVVTDTLQAGTTFVSASDGGTLAGQVVTWPTIASLAAGAARTFTVTVTTPATAGAMTDAAGATSATPDPNLTDNRASHTVTVSAPVPPPAPDVSVTKIAPATVSAGARVSYLIAVANDGPGDAANVVVTDTLPAGVTFVAATGSPTLSGNVLVWPNIPLLANGDKREFVVAVTAPAEAASITDIAAATTTSADPTLANNRATATTTVTASADVSIEKTGPATVVAAAPVTYTLTVRNNGPSTATGVVVHDTLPAGATFTSASGGGTAAAGVVTWPTIATLAASATQSFTLVITAPAAVGAFTNVAAVIATTADPNTANNRAALQTTSSAIPPTDADVSVGKSGPTSVAAGETITYSISVANAGPLDAANVSVTDTLPAGTTFVSATGGGTLTGNVVHWPVIVLLASGATQPFTLLVTAPADPATLTNIAAATSTTSDPSAANNRATTTTTVTATANVRIAKTGPSTATTSTAITYSLTVTNDGPSAAQTVVVTDTLQAGTTFVSASDGGSLAGQVVTWPAIASLAAGASRTFTVTVTTPPTAGTVTNATGVTSATPDPNLTDNRATHTVTVSAPVPPPAPDVSVTKIAPATVIAGGRVVYLIAVANSGPGDAANVVVTDTLPAGVTVVSTTGSPTQSGTVLTWPNIPLLANGDKREFAVEVTAPAEAATITDIAAATTTSADPTLANNRATATTTVTASADVSVDKAGPATVVGGTSVTYTITVRNAGPSTAAGVVVNDTLPPGATVTSASGGGTAAGGVVTWPTIATLAAGATQVFTLVITAPAGGPFTNVVAATATTGDPNTTNNHAALQTTVGPAPPTNNADVSVGKSGPASVVAGATITYSISVANAGPLDAANVSVTDTLPAGTTFVSATGGGTVTGNVVHWPVIASLASGSTQPFTLLVTAPPEAATLTNIAAATSTTPDSVTANNRAPTTTTVTASANVRIAKTGPSIAATSAEITFAITVTNDGPSAAQTVVVTDTLPSGVTFLRASDGGSLAGQVVTWPTIASLAAGAPRTFTLTVITGSAAGIFTDVAGVTSATPDPNLTDNRAVHPVTVTAPVPQPTPDVSVTKVAPATVAADEPIKILIMVTNAGPGDALNVIVTDTLPAGVAFVAATGSPTLSGNVLVWPSIPLLENGGRREFVVQVTAPAEAATITDIAAATTTSADPTLANNRATATTTVTASADVSIEKTGPATVVAAAPVTYTLTVRNNGPSTATGVVVHDTLPAGATFTSASGGGTAAAGVVTWPTIATLAAGATQSFTLVITAPAAVGAFTNVAAATATTADPNAANNRAALQTTSSSVPPTDANVSVTKSGPASIPAGAVFIYRLTVANAGPLGAANVVVTDTLPPGTTFVSATDVGVIAGNVVQWPAIPLLASGAARTFTVVVTAPPDAATLTNVAAATSATPDPSTANNRATATTTVTATAGVRIAKTGPSLAPVGTDVAFAITVTNDGPSTAQTVVLTDTLPAGATFVSASDGGSLAGQVVTWPAIASLAAGASRTFTLTVTTRSTAGAFTDVAAVTSATPDPNLTDNRAAHTVLVTTVPVPPTADIAVSKQGPATVGASAPFNYTIRVDNLGPGNADNVVVTDSLPPTLQFISASNGGALAGGVIAWPRIATLGAGTSQTYTVSVVAPPAGVIVNVVAATSTTPDPNPSNNNGTTTSSVTTNVKTSADVSVTKRAANGLLLATLNLYRITVRNTGPSDAQDVVVTDVLPPGLVFGQASDGGVANGQRATWPTIPTLKPGDSLTFDLLARTPDGPPAAGATFTNTARAVATTFDPDTTNNVSSVTNVIGFASDIVVEHAAQAAALPGAVITWTLTTSNRGPTVATGVVVRDSLSPGVTVLSASNGGSFAKLPAGSSAALANSIVTWPRIDTLRSGEAVTFTVEGRLPATGSVTNVASATSTSHDPFPANNNGSQELAQATTVIVGAADVVMVKTGPKTALPGEIVTSTIRVYNRGPDTARVVTVQDSLSSNASFISASRGGTISSARSRLAWPVIRTLAPSDTVTFDVTVQMPLRGTVIDVVSGDALSPDPVASNNDGSADSARLATVVLATDLALTKRAVAPFTVGALGRWVFTVENIGNLPTTAAMTLVDSLPAGVRFSGIVAPANGWSCATQATNARVVTCTHPDTLGAGKRADFTITTFVDAAAGALTNRAVVTSPGDPDLSNNSAVAAITPTDFPVLVIDKQAAKDVVEVGDFLDYTLRIRNLVADVLPGVALTDTLPLGFSYLAGSARIDGAALADPGGAPGPRLVFDLGAIPASRTLVLTYRVRVGPAAPVGDATNRAFAANAFGARSNHATARVRVEGGVFTDRGTIVGRVTLRGSAAVGVPGVRVLLEDGTGVITDGEGKYSIVGVSPRVHVLKLDATTLPPDAHPVVTSSRQVGDAASRFVDLQRSELARGDFVLEGSAATHATVETRREAAARDELRVPGIGTASEHGAEGGTLTRAARAWPDSETGVMPAGNAYRIELRLPSSGVPADGNTPVPVHVRIVTGDTTATTAADVTLEATRGRWDVVDADSTQPGIQTKLRAGEGEFTLLAPSREGAVEVRVTSGRASQTDTVVFLPAVRPIVLAGLLEARLDLRSLSKGSLLSVTPNDAFEDQIEAVAGDWDHGLDRAAARAALFLRGKVKGDVLLTIAYDSERDTTERTFRDIRPEEFYPVYGDASKKEFGAQSFERLYVRLDAKRSFVMYGDFSTTPTTQSRALAAYQRTFTGALGHLETPTGQLNVYGSRQQVTLAVDEIPGRGVSGPYTLSSPNGRLNTERVEILTRDRTQPTRIIRIVSQERFVDYTLEPFTGRLLFRRPIPSLDEYLNPVSIRVSFEVERDGARYWAYGADGSTRVTNFLEVGGIATRDRTPQNHRDLYGANATLSLGAATRVVVEWARTTADSAGTGNAGRVELRHHSTNVDVVAFAERTDSTFANPFSTTSPDRKELGLRGAFTVTNATRLLIEAIQSEDRSNGGRLNGAHLSIEQALNKRFTVELGYRWSSRGDSAYLPTMTGVAAGDVNAVTTRLSAALGGAKPGSLYAEFEQSANERDARRVSLGGEYWVDPRVKLYGRTELINSFAGPYALNDQQGLSSTVLGVDATWLRTGKIFSEYRLRDAVSGRDGEAAIGLRNRWTVARGVAVDGSFERVHVTEGPDLNEATAVTGALEYTRAENWRGTARLEFRDAKLGNDWLATAGYALKMNRDFTLLGRGVWSDLASGDHRDRAQLGLAWRELGDGHWNALARVEHLDERLGALPGLGGTHTADVFSAHVNWQPWPSLTVSPIFAAKAARDHGGALDASTTTMLGQFRVVQDIGHWWDVGATGSLLGANAGLGSRYGLGAEIGRRLIRNLRAATGYNVFGFRDTDLHETDYTLRGAYLRLDFKFDERTLGLDR